MLRRGATYYILVLLAGLTLMREAKVGVFAGLEDRWNGFLGSFGTAKERVAPVTVIELNDSALEQYPWPWEQDDFALFFETTLSFDPQSLIIDTPLNFDDIPDDARERQSMFERMLHERILRTPKLVLGARLGWATESQSVPDVQPMPVIKNIKGDLGKIPEFATVEVWSKEDFRLSSQPGWVNLPDQAGPSEKCPLIFRYRGQPVPGIVLQSIMLSEMAAPEDVFIELGNRIKVGAGLSIPIDESGRMRVNFTVQFNRIAYDDLVLTRNQLDNKTTPKISEDVLKNKQLFFTRTDSAARNIIIPGGGRIAPGELFAGAIATIHRRAFIERADLMVEWALIALAAFVAITLPKWRLKYAWIFTLLAAALYTLAAWTVCKNFLILLPGVMPLGLILLLFLFRLAQPKIERAITL